MATPEAWVGLRGIDRQLDLPKGSAFRGFKKLARNWVEGNDYRVLRGEHDQEQIRVLKDQGAIYAGSVNVVLLAPLRAAELRAFLSVSAIKR